MFPLWDFTRSSLIKRVCKFLLKKKLGEVLLGDIDLDQLDVQLTTGTIHLSDLALNVDFLNQKIAGSPIMVKEGSIKSLSIRIPWKLRNCEIDINEVELILGQVSGSRTTLNGADCLLTDDSHQIVETNPDKAELSSSNDYPGSIPLDLHEGVKTIAKVVKWFLTSFHVRLNGVIVAFDPHLETDGKRDIFHKLLVLRIKETEFGTCVSEDSMAKLTNFVKFQEANVEFLMEGVDDTLDPQNVTVKTLNERFAQRATTSILSGTRGGFSGTLNLSIPWKNGYLDISKVDADVSVDAMELRVQPSTIGWVINTMDYLKSITKAERKCNHKASDSLNFTSRSRNHTSMMSTIYLDANSDAPAKASELRSIISAITPETIPDALLMRTNVIDNWVPQYDYQQDPTDMEPDLGASIDQFFECFDGMRSSKMSSGTGGGGIWNWTCSVFNAISVASNLASGVGDVPKERHVETRLQAAIAGIFVILFISDEDQQSLYQSRNLFGPLVDQLTSGPFVSCHSSTNIDASDAAEINPVNNKMHHLEAKCQNVALNLETFSQNTIFSASVEHIKVNAYYYGQKHAARFPSQYCMNTSNEELFLRDFLKEKVQDTLPPFPFRLSNCDSELNLKDSILDGLSQVRLLQSFGNCSCRFNVNSKDSNGMVVALTLFAVHLPPFVLWFHYNLVDFLLDFFESIKSSNKHKISKDVQSDILCERNWIPSSQVADPDLSPDVASVPPRSFFRGNIVFPQARIVICFPSEYYGDLRSPTFLDKLIVLEHSVPSNVKEVSDTFTVPNSLWDQSSTSPSSIHLSTQNFELYLVASSDDVADDGICNLENKHFFAEKVVSVTGITKNSCSGVTLLWREGPVTGSWMVDRAWKLSSCHDQSRNRMIGNGSEFSSITGVDNPDETSENIRQELILSSAFLLHIQLGCVWINLDNHDYRLLNCLRNNVIDGCCRATVAMDGGLGTGMKDKKMAISSHKGYQTSILVNCDAIDACIGLNEMLEVSHLLQKELHGLWNCFKLKIDKFELLSSFNIGGIVDAKLLWINHREGELWGSIFNKDEKLPIVAEDLLLITCRDSAMSRGNGEGANVLTFGSAGTALTNICNPLLQQIYTSIVVRCATVIAPGGRLDWISSLCSYFSSSAREKENSDNYGTTSKLYFFLDLVDVALCYEPHKSQFTVREEDPNLEHNCDVQSDMERAEVSTGCLLAAATFNLSNHTNSDSTVDCSIQLKDVGFLICESYRTASEVDGYSVDFLQKSGYSKVAQISLLQAALRIKGLFWELEFADSHVNIESCRDTTSGLFRLIAQFQQLYAPDIEDSLMHLQSRWNNIQREDKNQQTSYIPNIISSNSTVSASTSKEEHQTYGLLDGILENAFECNPTTDRCDVQYPDSLEQCKLEHLPNFNTSAVDAAASFCSTEMRDLLHKPVSSHVIESYYASDMLPLLSPCIINHSLTADSKSTSGASSHRDIEYSQGGWYKDDGLMIVEDHISTIQDKHAEKHQLQEGERESEKIYGERESEKVYATYPCLPKGRVLVKNMDARWRMFAGFDWVNSKGGRVCSMVSSRKERGTFLELSLNGLYLHYDMFPEGETIVSKLSLTIYDFHLYDRSSDAPWKMVLGNYHSRDHPRESCAKVFKLDLEAVRPNPLTPLEDYRLYLELLPLRLNLDQTQLNFLTSFFSKDSFDDPSPGPPNILDESDAPITRSRMFGSQIIAAEALLPFFQKCVVKSLVIRVDYIPRHFDPAALRRGNYAELLNLVPWKGIDLHLKQVCAIGVYGWGNVIETVVGEWLEDIAHNQVRELLKGLPPMKSLFAVSSGTKKLVSLPVKSYRKDYKLLKGMQRGAMAFVKSISIEAVGLGVHLAAGAHEFLLQTEYILTPISLPVSEIKRKKSNIRSNQPENAQEGFQQAYESLSDGFGRTTSALLGSPIKAYQRGGGAGSTLATAIRGAPAAAIAPISASARAVHCTLLGLRNSIDPEHKKESIEKYQEPSQS